MRVNAYVSGGSANVEPATLRGTGEVHFKPDHTKFLKAATSNMDLKVNMCMACGNIALVGDVEKAKAITTSSTNVARGRYKASFDTVLNFLAQQIVRLGPQNLTHALVRVLALDRSVANRHQRRRPTNCRSTGISKSSG